MIQIRHQVWCNFMLLTVLAVVIYSSSVLSYKFKLRARTNIKHGHLSMTSNGDADLLVRALRGEVVERPPVWLMRQAGRYISDFRKYSLKYPFRQRAETPDIAVELSLQPWRKFGVDGVIMFSDILTPLPALGIEFSIVPNRGPKILNPVSTRADVEAIQQLHSVEDQVPFLSTILQTLSMETQGKTSLIGFIGAPWTLAAYSVEGGHSKLCSKFKTMCFEDPTLAHTLLDKITEALCVYASHQIKHGAQVLQVFESWAHHLSGDQFLKFAKPYANRVMTYLRSIHPDVPIVYFANGGSRYLHEQMDMCVNGISLDWGISMRRARAIVGSNLVLAGNVDPVVLYGSKQTIQKTVRDCIFEANCVSTTNKSSGSGSSARNYSKHVLNLGHGVEKDTPESAVRYFVEAARSM